MIICENELVAKQLLHVDDQRYVTWPVVPAATHLRVTGPEAAR